MFSKYEVYSTVQSMYCYNDTNVLKNKFGIKDLNTLKCIEEEIVSAKLYELMKNPVLGRFSKTHFFKIHQFLFGDIYSFAGKIRKEQIWKGDTMFYPPNSIDNELHKIFNVISDCRKRKLDKDELLDITAYIMTELNIVHPFREGNGRTIREFIRQWFWNFGYNLNWGNVDKDIILEASIKSVDDYRALVTVLNKCIEE